jgi:P-type Ca2+ transporter type 2C
VLHALVVHVGFLQALFDTRALTLSEWLIAVGIASSVVWVEELRKLVVRQVAAFESPSIGNV